MGIDRKHHPGLGCSNFDVVKVLQNMGNFEKVDGKNKDLKQ